MTTIPVASGAFSFCVVPAQRPVTHGHSVNLLANGWGMDVRIAFPVVALPTAMPALANLLAEEGKAAALDIVLLQEIQRFSPVRKHCV